MKEFTTKTEAETKKVAEEFAAGLKPGDIVELIGELGSGKTTFTRGIVQALGSNVRVKSPTFTVMNEYPVNGEKIKRVVHLDLYRFNTPQELGALALEDYMDGETVLFVEWPNLFDVPLFQNAKKIEFAFTDEFTREIKVM